MDASEASRTAVLVCQGRAVAHERTTSDRFDDPTAMALLTGPERAQVESACSDVVPRGFGERIEYERLRAVGDVMVPRTVAIDDAVRERPMPQLVILGAGLDGRGWRMTELADTDVFEVDHPTSQHDKRGRAASLEPVAHSIRFVSVDFAHDSLGRALSGAGHDNAVPTTWIWEGVIPYLDRGEVEATLRAIADASAPGSRLIVNYQTTALSSVIGRAVATLLTTIARRPNPLAHEPWRSSWTPDGIRQIFARYGFAVIRDDDLLSLASRLSLTVKARRFLQHGRVATADCSRLEPPADELITRRG